MELLDSRKRGSAQSRTRAAVCFRRSTAPPADTVSVFVRTTGSSQSSPSRLRRSGGGVSLVVDGDDVGEVDWAAEAPSPERLYRTVAHSGVEEVLAGGRASFIACGQAGSGKSSTLFFHEMAEGARAGLLPRVAMHLFAELPASCRVSASFIELYNDQIFDLLARGAPVRLRETPSHAAERDGGHRIVVRTATELIELLRSAEMGRHVSVRPRMQPSLARSHRGHALLSIFVGGEESEEGVGGGLGGGLGGSGSMGAGSSHPGSSHTGGKITFVDLAGPAGVSRLEGASRDPPSYLSGTEKRSSFQHQQKIRGDQLQQVSSQCLARPASHFACNFASSIPVARPVLSPCAPLLALSQCPSLRLLLAPPPPLAPARGPCNQRIALCARRGGALPRERAEASTHHRRRRRVQQPARVRAVEGRQAHAHAAGAAGGGRRMCRPRALQA